MNTIKDTVIIKVVPDEKSVKTISGSDKKIHMLTHFRENEEDVCIQSGTVFATPRRLSNKQEVKIAAGDKVYTHHHLTHHSGDTSGISPNTFAIKYRDIYCRIVDGEIEMLSNWNLLEPVEEPKNIGRFLINPSNKKVTGVGIVRYPSEGMTRRGVTNGTLVEFKRNAGYIILIEGVKYYRISDEHIFMAHGAK